ncbi:MAG: two pore domain potassium channel family protein [Comamonadaceae bacterium]|nr:MAG: two pore domain potassium channel family protein [Comamonadaceae bacterium]
MPYVAALAGLVLVVSILIDAFEVVLLPRPVRRHFRINHYFFSATWRGWSALGRHVRSERRREDFLGVYGPMSMVAIFTLWGVCLIVGFGLLHWAVEQLVPMGTRQSLASAMVVSGDAFFTLGYGDIVPRHALARLLVILEAGTGFGFIALTIGYLPVLYQHFARRDVQLVEFAARAGSPPTAATLLAWHGAGERAQLQSWLRDWELWGADLIESHSVYPMLAFYRSQHEGQSWLAALAVLMDCCALLVVGGADGGRLQAAATFSAMGRVLDQMGDSLRTRHAPPHTVDRLDAAEWGRLRPVFERALPDWRDDAESVEALRGLRARYEPQLVALSAYLLLPMPAWVPKEGAMQTACFDRDRLIERLGAPRDD